MSELVELCDKYGIKIKKIARTPKEPLWQDSERFDGKAWRVTLDYQNRHYSTDFFTGSAVADAPTVADVLYCILLDASISDDCATLDEFISEFGYEDRKIASKIWRQVKRTAPKIKAFVGERFDELRQAEH